MKHARLALSLIVVASCPRAVSADLTSTMAPTAADIRALLHASGTDDIATQVGPVAAQQLIVALRRASPGLPARADPIVKDVVVTYLRRQAEQDRVADRLIPIYAKYLTKDDVRQLTEFYRSPAGRKLVTVTPAISLESAKVGQEWVESILPGLQSELIARLKSEKLID